MGYYINVTSGLRGKTEFLIQNYDAMEATVDEAEKMVTDADLAVVIVIDNGSFEAVLFASSPAEFKLFTRPDDTRPKRFLVMDRQLVEQLTGYDKRKQ